MSLHPENDETVAMPAAPTPRPVSSAQRFSPGTLLASRYRIVSRLGKGGMGEVFRAEDIMLGQPVALKFLPENAGRNVNLLTRFYDEVRIARQISHANVCRVYDIGEIDGQPYLSMEYIDGEDLSSLLRRIGRLPGDKAAEFARKMCAGLAAAHAQGVLHRDIKPGNIMIDGRGEPRITDFGLAAVAAGIEGSEIRNGTPAYMAPEQLEGREVSVQSDIYALGLVFHEMFTGRVAHDAETVAELTEKRKGAHVTKASTLVADLDPAVDRAIHACLEPDPKLRPKSALELARMLPGGDPLAAALAAGQTPSPDLVAASGSKEALSPKFGLAMLAALFIGLTGMATLSPKNLTRMPVQNPPEVMVDKARSILRDAGYSEPARDFAWGYGYNSDNLDYVKKFITSRQQWDAVLSHHPTPLFFWYRESPRTLRASFNADGVVGTESPDLNVSGMTLVVLGLKGELIQFNAVPPQKSDAAPGSTPVDWSKEIALAHLDPARLNPSSPLWTSLVASDSRVAWEGTLATGHQTPPEIPIRVEAASNAGKPVYFEVIYPWTKASRLASSEPVPSGQQWAGRAVLALVIFIVIAALVMAQHHWRTGRGDRKAAFRIGVWVGCMATVVWALRAHHADIDFELEFVPEILGRALYIGFIYWALYLALEPWVRRYWPQSLVGWTRVLQGHWADPLVGRDVLIATLTGTFLTLYLTGVRYWIALTYNDVPGTSFNIMNLSGTSTSLSLIAQLVQNGVVSILAFLMLLFVLRVLLRKSWLALAAFSLVGGFAQSIGASIPLAVSVLFWAGAYFAIGWVMLNRGLLSAITMILTLNLIALNLATTDFTAWYGQSSWMVIAFIAGLGAWGYHVAVAGRSLLDEAPAK